MDRPASRWGLALAIVAVPLSIPVLRDSQAQDPQGLARQVADLEELTQRQQEQIDTMETHVRKLVRMSRGLLAGTRALHKAAESSRCAGRPSRPPGSGRSARHRPHRTEASTSGSRFPSIQPTKTASPSG